MVKSFGPEYFKVKCAVDVYEMEKSNLMNVDLVLKRFENWGFTIENPSEMAKRYLLSADKRVVFADEMPDGYYDCGSNYELFELLASHVAEESSEQIYMVENPEILGYDDCGICCNSNWFYWLNSQMGCEPWNSGYTKSEVRKASVDEIIEMFGRAENEIIENVQIN